ncbi:MAG: hypothetical protein H0T42_04150 [Deltaproteobacteria bacterium]|nr:hypothetical protein [Deltaproteobacteria bacterium]
MSGPKRSPDQLNTIGIIVIGICSAVLVYVSIVALQAFYMNDTSDIQTMADYGGNDVTARTIKTSQIQNISEFGANPAAPGKTATYRTSIDVAMKQVVDAAKVDPAALVPVVGRSDKATVQPVFGRPPPTAPTTPADGGGAGSAAGTGSTTGAGTGSAAGAGSAATPAGGMVVPQTPTGGQGGGGSPGTAKAAPGGSPSPVGDRPPTPTGTGGATGSAGKGNGP